MSEQLKALAEQASSDVEWIVTHESGVVHKVTERLERLAEEAYALALLTAAGPTELETAVNELLEAVNRTSDHTEWFVPIARLHAVVLLKNAESTREAGRSPAIPLGKGDIEMGYMRHHAIVVTSYDDKIEAAHAIAHQMFDDMVSPVVNSHTNGYRSFFIAPDGSKEGRGESNDGDARREAFKAWLDQQRYDDHSTWLRWVEVQYGDDEHETKIVSDSDASPQTPERP